MAKYQIIKVTRKHIRNGCQEDSGSCPVALALLEQANVVYVSVDNDVIRASTGKKKDPYYGFSLLDLEQECSRSVTRFVNKFDKTGKGKPFNFRWRVSH
jgi:hypothetical protein